MSASGSMDRLLIRLMSLSLSSTRCQACSRLPLKQQYTHDRFGGATRRSTSLPYILTTDSHSPFSLRSYSTSLSSSSLTSAALPIIQQKATVSHDPIATDHPRQRDATTSIAMIHCAKRNDPDQCLQHYLQLLRTQGKLPSHEALHQLARVLYNNQHLSGFSILHDTLLAYYTLHPLSAKQSRNLTYIYTMLINLIIRKPDDINKRSSSFTNKKQHASTPSSLQSKVVAAQLLTSKQMPTSSVCHMSSSSSASTSCHSSPQTAPMDVSPPPPTSETPSSATTSTFMEEKTTTIIQLCQEMRQLGLTATPAFYNSLLKFCVMKKDSALAWNFYNELASACAPTKQTFSILLDLTRQQRDTAGTLFVLDAMDQNGVLPDRAIVSTVMLTLCDQQQYTKAADFVDQLAHECPQLMGPIYKSVLMETLHRHYCEHGPTASAAAAAARQLRRLANRKNKRKQAHLDSLQPQQVIKS